MALKSCKVVKRSCRSVDGCRETVEGYIKAVDRFRGAVDGSIKAAEEL